MDKVDNSIGETRCSDNISPVCPGRRHFLGIGAIGILAAPLGNFLVSGNAEARGSTAVTSRSKEISKLPESDPQAKALGYKAQASEVDRTKFNIKENAYCRNCQLYSGIPNEEWGPCAIFSYRINPILNTPYLVHAGGWCVSWAPRNG